MIRFFYCCLTTMLQVSLPYLPSKQANWGQFYRIVSRITLNITATACDPVSGHQWINLWIQWGECLEHLARWDLLPGLLFSLVTYHALMSSITVQHTYYIELFQIWQWFSKSFSSAHGVQLMCSPNVKDFEYPLAIRASAILFFALSGTTIAWSLALALGDATWSVSTGIGSCFLAAIYEAGRPDRLTSEEAEAMEAKYREFGKHL